MRNHICTAALAAAVLYVSGASASSDAVDALAPDGFQFAGNATLTPATQAQRDISVLVPKPLNSPIHVTGTSVASWGTTDRIIAMTKFGWDGIADGKGVIIGIVDSGIDLNHPEFVGRVLKGACFSGGSTICGVTDATKGGDPGIYPAQTTHGTHVAGIAAGDTVGLATAASILPVKVCDSYSSNCPGDVDAGIIWASQHGAKVINLSLGGDALFSTDIAAAASAISHGALLVVAAGNAGVAVPVGGYLAGAALEDGVRGAMIVVGATGKYNVIAPFSQTPGSTCEMHGGVNYCMRDYFVVAPGKGIKSSVGGGSYAQMSGTSMATPYVSGVAAVIKGLWPTLTPYQVASIILQTADDLGAVGPDDVYGRGAVDIAAAVSPIGGPDVFAVTSGTTLSTAEGTTDAINSASTGIFAMALSDSKLLKHAVLVDSYGRNFSADLTKLVQGNSLSLAGFLRDPFQTLTPFAVAETGSFGAVSVSGYVEQRDTPQFPDAQGSLQQSLTTTQNLAISLSPIKQLSFDFGHNLNLSGYFNADDASASPNGNGLFLSSSTLDSPYVAIADGGNFSGVSFAPTDTLRFRFGFASLGESQSGFRDALSPEPYRNALTGSWQAADAHGVRSTIAGAYWDFARWGGIGLTATSTEEQNATLGGFTAGAFSFANQSATQALGASAHLNVGSGWVTTLVYNEGLTKIDLTPGGLATAIDPVESRAYGIAFTKHFIFGNDAIGFALTRPLYVAHGGVTLRAATGIDADQNLTFGTETLNLSASRPETDMEFGYMTRLLGGGVALQLSGAYQMDVSGIAGKNAIAALTRVSMQL